jgi:arylsulfatase A-like enzyme
MGAKRPDVLVILTDDQRWDALGVVQREQGDRALFPWFQTHSLDRVAAELYDLRRDPFELRNLASDPQFAPRREELDRALEALSKEIGPDSMPVYKGIQNVLPKY